MDITKTENFHAPEGHQQESERITQQNGRKYLQTIYLIRDSDLEYKKDSYNSI